MVVLDIAFYIFAAVVIIQGVFYISVFGNLAFHRSKPLNKRHQLPVSVLICAKNEAKNLKEFLPFILNQNYPTFEIVLINDASNDDTLEVMEAYSKKYNNIKIVNVAPVEVFWGNKKYPLTLGIKASKHNILLFTDADCKPVSTYWIAEMMSNFNTETAITLGYGAYTKVKKSFLNKLIRFETIITAISYFSMAKVGIPYMGVGRNLAYTKKHFFKVRGFMDHMNIRSGDDDLFVNQAADRTNTAVCLSQNSFTTSIPKSTFKDWFKQKRRHISTVSHYKSHHKIILASFYITNFLFWILSIILLVLWHMPIYVLSLIVIRLGIQYYIYGLGAKKLNEKDLIAFIPFLEIFLILFQLAIFITNKISKPKHWK
ncbi:MAG: glycosyltransferase [Jejuia sp.]